MYRGERHPLNAEGDFFVEYNLCLACDAPRGEAPELIDYDSDGHCYLKRQPHTAEEVDQAVSAVRVSCVEAVLYGGNDPAILAAIYSSSCRVTSIVLEPTFSERLKDGILKALRRFLNR